MKLLEKSGGILDFVVNHYWITTTQQNTSSSSTTKRVEAAEAAAAAAASGTTGRGDDTDLDLLPATKKLRRCCVKAAKSTTTEPDHPSSDGITRLQQQQDVFRYLDVGCNEGDLTMEVARAVAARLFIIMSKTEKDTTDNNNNNNNNASDASTLSTTTSSFASTTTDKASKSEATVTANGIDIDDKLIRRANRKHNNDATTFMPMSSVPILPTFHVANVLSSNFLSLLANNNNVPTPTSDHDDDNSNNNNNSMSSSSYLFDFASLFSTTMWIHIHGGDDGLRRALGNICRCTKSFVLVEPQPSKWYVPHKYIL